MSGIGTEVLSDASVVPSSDNGQLKIGDSIDVGYEGAAGRYISLSHEGVSTCPVDGYPA